jgi:hypothetical protein
LDEKQRKRRYLHLAGDLLSPSPATSEPTCTQRSRLA